MSAVASLLPVAILTLLVFAQGGFFGLAPCLCGMLLCVISSVVWLRKRHRSQVLPIAAPLLCAVAAAYALSAAVNGLTLTTLAECGVWAGCAGIALLASSLDETTQARSLHLLCWLIALTSVLGMLVYVGAINFTEGMVEDRLQLTFQYANAAGAWFAVGTLLCVLAPDDRFHRLAAFPATALLLTQSVGALIVFALVAAAIGIMWARQQVWDRLAEALLVGCAATLCFALLHVARSPITVAILVALLAVYVLHEDLLSYLAPLGWQRMSLVLVTIMVVAAAAGLLMFGTRVGQAASSMAERGYHVHDGLSLWIGHPLLGIGPDNWQYVYHYVQTAQYNTAVVHSSYVQMLLDAGFVGLVLFAAAAFFGMRELVEHASSDQEQDASTAWFAARIASAAFLLLHSALEFDLQFASLAFLLAFLLSCEPQDVQRSSSAHHAKRASNIKTVPGIAAGIACLVVCLPLCALGTMSELTTFSQRTALATGDYAACKRLCTAGAFSRNDVAAQERLIGALCAEGDYVAAVSTYQAASRPSDTSTLRAADACYRLGDRKQAGLILIGRMEQQPYNAGFFDEAAELVGNRGLDEDLHARYRSAVNRANTLAQRVTPQLPQQQVSAGI